MNNGSKYSKAFVILGVLLIAAGLMVAAVNFAGFGFKTIFRIRNIFGIDREANIVDVEKTESAKGIDFIYVKTVSDDISLIPVDSEEIKAHYHGSYSSTDPGYKPELVVEKNGSRLNIKSVHKSSATRISITNDLKLDVYIPRQFDKDIEIISTSGEVTVDTMDINKFDYTNVSGDLKAGKLKASEASFGTTSGEARISGKFDNFKFSSESGDLISDDFISSETTLNTTSGEIKLSGQPGDVVMKSVSGDLNLTYTDFNNNIIEAKTTAGDVRLRLPADAGFMLDYDTVSGDADCDFELSGSRDKHDLKGTAGRGGGSVKVHTVSGDFEISN